MLLPRVAASHAPLLALWTLSASLAHGEAKAPVVLVEPADMLELADTITYPARVTSKVQASVYAPVDGVVSRIAAPLGTTVRRGGRLLTIENTDPVYEYVPVGVETPVAGVVSGVSVTEGTKVTKGQELATVTDPKQLRLVVEVPASDLTAIRSGLDGTFAVGSARAKASPADAIQVTVNGVSPLVDPATGTATAELTFVSSTESVPIGVIGKVTFAVNKRQGIQVAEQSIVYRGKDTFVRTVENGKAKLMPVVVAETRRGLTEISSGLAKGALVIVRASGFVGDGQDVVVQEGEVAKK